MATLLRIATAGSVDDGKSTLIGRLLYDSKAVMEDQLAAVERTSKERGNDYTDLALVTDGLRAEREQGITIDVAYRYFATAKRKFIIADTPGHVQYTRNMVTGASTADLALVLVDARKGVIEQTRRHASLSALLRVPHLVLAVNKMDLVDFDQAVYDGIVADFMRQRTQAENVALFDKVGVTVGPVCDASDLPDHPFVQEREALVAVPDADTGTLPMHNVIPRLSKTPGSIRTPAPTLGQHNEEIYGSLGLAAGDQAKLKNNGVI